MNKKEVAGEVQQSKGKVQAEVGKAVGNPDLQTHGEVEQVKGAVTKKVGQIEGKVTTVKAKAHSKKG